MHKKKLISAVLVFLVVIQIFALQGFSASDDIKIVINGSEVKGDTAPFILNDRTMVPFRLIFEALGATVSWNSERKEVTGVKDDIVIKMVIGDYWASVNGSLQELDVPPTIRDNRTFVPLRFVAENLGTDVIWDGNSRTVFINEKGSTNSDDLTKHISTSNYSEEYFKADINGNSCFASGKLKDKIANKYLLLKVVEKSTENPVIETDFELDQDGKFSTVLDLKDLLDSNEYRVLIFTCNEKYSDKYLGWIYDDDVLITKSSGEVSFKKPKVYEANNTNHLAGINNPADYLSAEAYIESDNPAIINLANEITSKMASELDKALAIHDWVAKNIYYDYDAYYSGSYTIENTSALSVLNTKKSVCQGYASIFAALCRAVNLPCYIESGFALGISQSGKSWDEIDTSNVEANHAWNVVYINGKWIIVDATWDSGNEFKNGVYEQKEFRGYKYFDPTMYLFSTNHFIM